MYVTILNAGTSGRATVVFPNLYQPEARVKRGAVLKVPGDQSQWQINIQGPTGIELITVIASKERLTLPPQGLSGEDVLRHLSSQLARQSKAPAFGIAHLLVNVVGTR
jgi:hypothetical protein